MLRIILSDKFSCQKARKYGAWIIDDPEFDESGLLVQAGKLING